MSSGDLHWARPDQRMMMLKPGPDDIILHSCGGQPRAWMHPDADIVCATCRSRLLPEQPHDPDHARFHCSHCRQWIGLCGKQSFDGLLDEVTNILTGQMAPA